MCPCSTVIFCKCYSVLMMLNTCSFTNSDQFPSLVHLTHTTGYISIFCNSVAKLVAHHSVTELIIIFMAIQIIINELECLSSIIIICIDNCKRAIDHVLTAINCVCCSPWFHTSFRHLKTCRNIIDFLICIRHFHVF